MVSHELRTPLSTISMSVETSLRRIEGSADQLPKEWLLQRLEKARKAVSRTDRLIHTFLGMSQICTGRLVPDVQDVDLASLARNEVYALADELSWARCDCHLHVSRPERGRWDPVQLEIVLHNLLTNAIKYAPGCRVDVCVEGCAEDVTLIVQDRGPGIAGEHRGRLFQRFSRLPSSSRVNGFGLGLWITSHFVRANGGNIELESEPGRGTTFRVRLPREGSASIEPGIAPR
jgi:signal transduction histidine kinase